MIEVPGVQYVFVARHQPDNGTKCVHMHMVIRTALSHKKLRKAVRLAYGLEHTMDLMFRPYDETKMRSLVKYYIDHDHAEILTSEEPFTTVATEVRAELEAPTGNDPLTDAQLQARWDEEKALVQRYIDLHRDEWDIEPPIPYDIRRLRYVDVMDAIEIMTKHWSQQASQREWEFMTYARKVLEYVVWPGHEGKVGLLYRSVYSEFRFRGDVKLLYARYWSITPSLLRRIFGHD